MNSWQPYFDAVIKKLIYQHAHSNSKKKKKIIQSHLADGLDFDQAGRAIEAAARQFEFVHCREGYVWYEQTEPLLIYITENSEMKLNNVGTLLSHLTPPSLRSKYGIITKK